MGHEEVEDADLGIPSGCKTLSPFDNKKHEALFGRFGRLFSSSFHEYPRGPCSGQIGGWVLDQRAEPFRRASSETDAPTTSESGSNLVEVFAIVTAASSRTVREWPEALRRPSVRAKAKSSKPVLSHLLRLLLNAHRNFFASKEVRLHLFGN